MLQAFNCEKYDSRQVLHIQHIGAHGLGGRPWGRWSASCILIGRRSGFVLLFEHFAKCCAIRILLEGLASILM